MLFLKEVFVTNCR